MSPHGFIIIIFIAFKKHKKCLNYITGSSCSYVTSGCRNAVCLRGRSQCLCQGQAIIPTERGKFIVISCSLFCLVKNYIFIKSLQLELHVYILALLNPSLAPPRFIKGLDNKNRISFRIIKFKKTYFIYIRYCYNDNISTCILLIVLHEKDVSYSSSWNCKRLKISTCGIIIFPEGIHA